MTESTAPVIEAEEQQSPCIGVCAMDEKSGFCYGCYRTLEEIKAWWKLSSQEREEALQRIETRVSAHF